MGPSFIDSTRRAGCDPIRRSLIKSSLTWSDSLYHKFIPKNYIRKIWTRSAELGRNRGPDPRLYLITWLDLFVDIYIYIYIYIYMPLYLLDAESASIQTRATPMRGCASRDQSDGDIRCLRIFYSQYNQCVTWKYLTLKMKVKVMEYNIRNGKIRWKISTSIKVIRAYFRHLSASSSYSYFKIRDLENIGKGHAEQHSQWRQSMASTWSPIWWQ